MLQAILGAGDAQRSAGYQRPPHAAGSLCVDRCGDPVDQRPSGDGPDSGRGRSEWLGRAVGSDIARSEARAARSAEEAVQAQKEATRAAKAVKFLEPTTKRLPRGRTPARQWPSDQKGARDLQKGHFRRQPPDQPR